MSVTIAVTSGKGGVGKTMFAVNFAALMAMNDCRVLILDMNTGLRSVDICLGLENKIVYDLEDIVLGNCSVRKAMVRDERFTSLCLLSASQNRDKVVIRSCDMKRLLSEVSDDFDFVIIDAPAGLGEDWQTSVRYADWAVVLLTQEYASVRDADTADVELKKLGVDMRFAILNKLRSENFSKNAESCFPTLFEVADMLHMPVAGGILEDDNIHLSLNGGIPVVCSTEGYILNNFRRIFLRMQNMADH
ncbi:MAG: AAA family ATPase [Firmicutes bacterium]|nr:AAA family ATPase [Bacillota bacterium]